MELATVAKSQVAASHIIALFKPTTILAKTIGSRGTFGIGSVGVFLAFADAVTIHTSSGVFLNCDHSTILRDFDDRGRIAIAPTTDGGTHANFWHCSVSHCVILLFVCSELVTPKGPPTPRRRRFILQCTRVTNSRSSRNF